MFYPKYEINALEFSDFLVWSQAIVLNPFRTAAPFGGQTTFKLNGLSPQRNCGSKRVVAKGCSYFSVELAQPSVLRINSSRFIVRYPVRTPVIPAAS